MQSVILFDLNILGDCKKFTNNIKKLISRIINFKNMTTTIYGCALSAVWSQYKLERGILR